MFPTKQAASRYNIVVKNKPGELARLTKFLADTGMNVSSLQVANLGSKASIQFSAPDERNLREGLLKTGLRAHVG